MVSLLQAELLGHAVYRTRQLLAQSFRFAANLSRNVGPLPPLGTQIRKTPFLLRQPSPEFTDQVLALRNLAGSIGRGVGLQIGDIRSTLASIIATLSPLLADMKRQFVARHAHEQLEK